GPAPAEEAAGAAATRSAEERPEKGSEGSAATAATTTAAGPAEAGPAEEARGQAGAPQERGGKGAGAFPEGDRDAQGARHAAPGRAPAEREGRAEEAAGGQANEEAPAEGLVRRLLWLALLLPAAPGSADDAGVRAQVDARKLGVQDQLQLTLTLEGA